MRIVFMATGEIAEPAFAALLQSDHEVLGLVTQPDRPVGRKQILTPPRVKEMAKEDGIPVIQPEEVREASSLQQLRDWNPEVIVVMAYGQILPQSLIEIPERAIINLHASLLPRYRGASCIQGALRAGDRSTGWSVIHVVKKLDAGNVLLRRELKIGEDETGGELHDRLAAFAPEVLLESLKLFSGGGQEGEPQDDSLSSYVPKLLREDGKIDWHLSAGELERVVRAYHPWPGTFSMLGNRRVKIFPPMELRDGKGEPGKLISEDELEIACGKGSLLLKSVQPEGKGQMDAAPFLRGYSTQLSEGFSSAKLSE